MNALKPPFQPEICSSYNSYKRTYHRNYNNSIKKRNGNKNYYGYNNIEESDESEEEEDEEDSSEREAKIDLRLRDKLFKHARPVRDERRNQSGGNRKIKNRY